MKNSIYTGGYHQQIVKLFTNTFPYEECPKEGSLLGKLAKDLLESSDKQDVMVFVSQHQNVVIGCVIFTRLSYTPKHTPIWLLSLVAVKPKARSKGIGKSLVSYAHHVLQQEGVQVVVVYGDIQFFGKIGYKHITAETIQTPLPVACPRYWLAKSLINRTIEPIPGKTYCVAAMNDTRYW